MRKRVANKPLDISESASVQMPMKTVASLIILVAMGVFAYTELTSRLVSLETSRELFENDLLKKSEQVPVDQEQLFLLEDLYKSVEKIEIRIENMMHNKVNIQFLQKQMEKRLTRQIIKHILDKKNKIKEILCLRSRQEVEIGANGTQKYMIKEGKNKGKIL